MSCADSKNTTDIWEEIHVEREWGAWPPLELVRWAHWIGLGPDKRVLDLGCGAGAATWFLAKLGCQVSAIDGSVTAVWRTIERLRHEGLQADVIGGDASRMPYDNNTFDAVVDIVCIAHNSLDKARGIWAEVARVLKPQGYFLSVVPAADSWRAPYERVAPVHFYEMREIIDVISTAMPTGTTYEAAKNVYGFGYREPVVNWIISGRKA